MEIHDYLIHMNQLYQEDRNKAIRGQGFIQILHDYIEESLNTYLTPEAKRSGIKVVREATLYGSHKAKDVDIAVIEPSNGPLLTVGVRSQMSSVGKNVLTYYQDIVGECISLQERFPMATMGYVYLHPLREPSNKSGNRVTPDHVRYARIYESIAQRDDRLYRQMTGSYDQFAYLVVDFDSDPPEVCDGIVRDAVPSTDLSIFTFADRMVKTFKKRNLWLDWVFY